MRRHTYKKAYSWNTNTAYLAGVIAADGCLINDGRHLNITSKDFEIITIAQTILDMNVKVGTKKSPYKSEAYSLQFSNVAFYDFLLKCGLTPAKSKTIDKLNVPDAFFPDFLRGYFDGDGTVYGFWDQRWRSSFMYYSAFASASPPFLQWLQNTSQRLAATTPGKIGLGNRVHRLTYAKTDSRKLFLFMYYTRGLPCLSRKLDKFCDFIKTDPYAKMSLVNARVLELVDRHV